MKTDQTDQTFEQNVWCSHERPPYTVLTAEMMRDKICAACYMKSLIFLNKYVAELYKHSESLSVPLYVGTDRAPAELQQRISNTRENFFFLSFFFFLFFKKLTLQDTTLIRLIRKFWGRVAHK